MHKKATLFTLLFTIAVSFLFAQEVDLKDKKVLLDGKEILKYEKNGLFQYSFYTIEADDEILMFKIFDNETPHNQNDDYYVLNFLTEKKKVESTDFMKIYSGMGMNYRKNMEKLITWLIKEKVLTVEGKINKDKLDIFYDKYNENITARTVR